MAYQHPAKNASTQMNASQHLRTFERVPVNKKLLTGTVLVNNLFLTFLLRIKLFFGTLPENNFLMSETLENLKLKKNSPPPQSPP